MFEASGEYPPKHILAPSKKESPSTHKRTGGVTLAQRSRAIVSTPAGGQLTPLQLFRRDRHVAFLNTVNFAGFANCQLHLLAGG